MNESNDFDERTILDWMMANPSLSYKDVCKLAVEKISRTLNRYDRVTINEGMLLFRKERASQERLVGEVTSSEIVVCTGYIADDFYTPIGQFCVDINRRYCNQCGYRFIPFVYTQEEAKGVLDSRGPCFLKIAILLNLLQNKIQNGFTIDDIQYLVWIDADAVVVDFMQRFEDIIAIAENREVIVGEDHHPVCLLNSGVMLLKANDAWVKNLLDEIWHDSKYFDKTHYEQSSLEAALRRRDEGLERYRQQEPESGPQIRLENEITSKPTSVDGRKGFYSYLTGSYKPKAFPHTMVMSKRDLNSDVVDDGDDMLDNKNEKCRFIFHPAGKKGKLHLLQTMAKGRGII